MPNINTQNILEVNRQFTEYIRDQKLIVVFCVDLYS